MLYPGDDKPKKLSSVKGVGPYLGLGTQLAVTMIVMVFLGYWLDEKLNTSPLLLIFFSLLGGFAAIYNFIKTVIELGKKEKRETND